MMLREIKSFFEIVALSNMLNSQHEQIIDYIEHLINKPIIDLLKR